MACFRLIGPEMTALSWTITGKLLFVCNRRFGKLGPQNRYRNLRNLFWLLDFGKELLESHAGSFTMKVKVPVLRIRRKSNP